MKHSYVVIWNRLLKIKCTLPIPQDHSCTAAIFINYFKNRYVKRFFSNDVCG